MGYIYIYMCYTMEMKKMCVGESGVPHNEIKIFFYNHGNKKKFFSFAYFFLKNFRRGSIAEHNIIHSFFLCIEKNSIKIYHRKKKFASHHTHSIHLIAYTLTLILLFFCISHSLATPCSICFANDPPSPSHHHLLTLTAVADA